MEYYYHYSLKTNLVNSTFLVLFNQIVKENKKKITIHIVRLLFFLLKFLGGKILHWNLKKKSVEVLH